MSFNYCPALATEAGIHCVPDIAVLIAIYIAQRNTTHDFIFLFDQINAYEKEYINGIYCSIKFVAAIVLFLLRQRKLL